MIKRLVLLLVVYQLLRVLFLALNPEVISRDGVLNTAWAFVEGFRFDLWAVVWTNLAVIAASCLPWRWQATHLFDQVLKGFAVTLNSVFIGINLIDVELYKFTGKRVTRAWLNLQKDLGDQTGGLLAYYWWLFLLFIAAFAVLLWLWPRWQEAKTPPSRSAWLAPVLTMATALSVLLASRGGWQLKPLNLAHAYAHGSSSLGVLRMNSTFTFLRSRAGQDAVGVRFFEGREGERDAILAKAHGQTSPQQGRLRGANVVLIIVESLASEYVGALNSGRGYTPFLDELVAKAVLFQNHFANGRRSIEAVPSLLCGLPSLMGEALILSPYQGIDLHCLPKDLKAAGYSTWFFHGAHNGSMHFDAFAARAGFERYVGMNEYPNRQDYDGQWGIFDEPFLRFMVAALDKAPAPFFATVFTLSSHNPYRIPEALAQRFPKGELEIHASIGYVDYSLRQFFDRAARSPWYANTVFIITGDHTQKSVEKRYQSLTGAYRVPLIVFIPNQRLEANVQKVTQHLDVPATVRDLLGISAAAKMQIGESAFAPGPGLAVNGDEHSWWVLNDGLLTEFHRAQARLVSHRFDASTWQMTPASGSDDAVSWSAQLLKAIIDYHNDGIANNRLYAAPASSER